MDIEYLRLTIEGKEILKDIDLRLRPGDTCGLLGPNGAGKATIIFAILGLPAYLRRACLKVHSRNAVRFSAPG
ncbi:ATP-binding cassette domain-containing protein [Desulfoprunum benzoelyticum]|uniref:ATP-binding cassette domain-containing protein n=1 Tax=Desulfoprunum benzoelyticum TaxID=1506996 RepID=UPI0016093212|nr:ATP-binding cassette domain-containing protein [Desulfoprunum benzoelyticum]